MIGLPIFVLMMKILWLNLPPIAISWAPLLTTYGCVAYILVTIVFSFTRVMLHGHSLVINRWIIRIIQWLFQVINSRVT